MQQPNNIWTRNIRSLRLPTKPDQRLGFSHHSPILVSLYRLPVRFRIDLNILLITFKPCLGLASHYIANILTPNEPVHTFEPWVLLEVTTPPPSGLWKDLPEEIRRVILKIYFVTFYHQSQSCLFVVSFHLLYKFKPSINLLMLFSNF